MPSPTQLIAIAALSLATAAPVAAQSPAAASASQPPHPGPYLPPGQRQPSGEPAASGPALRMQALQKLKLRFEQADLDASGSLTQEEARKAGLGFVVQHFAEIDQAQRGAISFEQLKAYLVERRKQARAQHVPGHDNLP